MPTLCDPHCWHFYPHLVWCWCHRLMFIKAENVQACNHALPFFGKKRRTCRKKIEIVFSKGVRPKSKIEVWQGRWKFLPVSGNSLTLKLTTSVKSCVFGWAREDQRVRDTGEGRIQTKDLDEGAQWTRGRASGRFGSVRPHRGGRWPAVCEKGGLLCTQVRPGSSCKCHWRRHLASTGRLPFVHYDCIGQSWPLPLTPTSQHPNTPSLSSWWPLTPEYSFAPDGYYTPCQPLCPIFFTWFLARSIIRYYTHANARKHRSRCHCFRAIPRTDSAKNRAGWEWEEVINHPLQTLPPPTLPTTTRLPPSIIHSFSLSLPDLLGILFWGRSLIKAVSLLLSVPGPTPERRFRKGHHAHQLEKGWFWLVTVTSLGSVRDKFL